MKDRPYRCGVMSLAMSESKWSPGDNLLPDERDLQRWTAGVIAAKNSAAEAACCASICKVLNQYLEQSTLLDPVLPEMIQLLSNAAIELRPKLRHRLFVVLYTVTKVRGAKYVTRILPHDPSTFRILGTLLCEAFPLSCSFSANWESHFFLLLWLSAAVLVPFPLSSIVPGSLLDALYDHGFHALQSTSKILDGAATFLAAFLTRKDTSVYLRRFFDACLRGKGTRGPVTGPAAAAALARIFKTGRRGELVLHVPALVAVLDQFVDENSTGGMKLKSKLSQRMALVFLKEHACNWRYERGSRLLFGTADAVVSSPAQASSFTACTVKESVGRSPDTCVGGSRNREDDEEGWIEPDEEEIVEQVVEILLRSLGHRDTVVRWSAAKGIGRIAGRLPVEHAEDVVEAVLDLFSSPAMARADSAWHGGCLAIAELARRGLVLPDTPHFSFLFQIVKRASAFDVRRGAHSVGAHVRDAACYIVWAVARAYTSEDVSSHAVSIWQTMIPTCLFDREVNCRRAASAALQECVGRFSRGAISEGIELVTLMDFFAIGDRAASYLIIAPKVASLSQGLYFDCILEELWAGKLMHWDDAVRSLASKSLAALASFDADMKLSKIVFPKLLQIVGERVDGLHRHGALLGLAELVNVLGPSLSQNDIDVLRAVPELMHRKGYFKGRLGDLTRSGVCRLIELCAKSDLPVYSTSGAGKAAAEEALFILEKTLGGNSDVNRGKSDQLAGISLSAYEHLCRGYVVKEEQWSAAICARVASGLLTSPLTELQRGYALAAGAMDPSFATRRLFAGLVETLASHADVEVRRNSALSLGKLWPHPDLQTTCLVVSALGAAMEDYAVDDRGDVGSWVREAAMAAFSSIFARLWTPAGLEDGGALDMLCCKGIDGLVTQSCERISRTRAVACKNIHVLCGISLWSRGDGDVAEAVGTRAKLADLGAVFGTAWDQVSGTSYLSADRAYMLHGDQLAGVACSLLNSKTLSHAALTGMIASCVGGVKVGKSEGWALASIYDHSNSISSRFESSDRLLAFGDSFLSIISFGDARLTVPAMQAFELLVRRGLYSTGMCLDFLLRAVTIIRGAWKGRLRDVKRVTAAIHLLSEVGSIRFADELDRRDGTVENAAPVRRRVMEALVVLLPGPVPRLRRVAAQSMYTVLAEQQALCGGGSDSQEALDVVADTPWELLEVPDARLIRNSLCKVLAVDAPKPPLRPPAQA